MRRRDVFLALMISSSLAACGPGKNNSSWSTAKPASQTAVAASSGASAATAQSGKGVGPVDHIDLASLDESREPIGEKLFQEKCSACHKLEERYIGPALTGVTTRRQPEWIMNMILNPDRMVKEDPTAKALLTEFLAPMTNQNLTEDEAEAILVYFREHDEEAREDTDDDEDSESAADGAR